jgi:predicted aspartyl protease
MPAWEQIYATITLTNIRDRWRAESGAIPAGEVRSRDVECLVDTGATALTIPSSLRDELGLETVSTKLAIIATGEAVWCDLVGPVEVRFENRLSIGTALVVPGDGQVLLGAIQMEDMDLIPDPGTQRLIVNPESPDRARAMLVSVQHRIPPGGPA